MTRLGIETNGAQPEQANSVKTSQQQRELANAGGHQNEAFEQETSAGTSPSGSDSSSGLADERNALDEADLEYEEKETTIEFSSITSVSSNTDQPPSQLARNLSGNIDRSQLALGDEKFSNSAEPTAAAAAPQDGKTTEATRIEFGGLSDFGDDDIATNDEPSAATAAANGFVVSWSNLDYVVESKWYKLTQQRKPILNNLSGCFKSGQLSAILGPSGAGKSTLVDCLLGKRDRGVSGRTRVSFASAQVEEQRRASGRPLRIATIPQEDHLLEALTVTETFMFASRIKNAHLTYEEDDEQVEFSSPPSSGKGKRKWSPRKPNRKPFDHFANVQRVIQQLDLGSCAGQRCGKLSGGQYKRVSIGQELLSRPDLMILDEPTSGLDSVTCYQTVLALRQLVDSSNYPMAIVSTIHQPDIEVFSLFHKAYVLASGGRTIYEGPSAGIFRTVGLALELVQHRRQHQPASFGPDPVAVAAATTKTCFPAGSPLDTLRKQLEQPPHLAGNPARLIVEVAAGKFGFEVAGAMAELQIRAHESGESGENNETGNGQLRSLDGWLETAVGDSPSKPPLMAPKFDYVAHDPSARRANLDKLLEASKATNHNRSLRVYLRHLALHTRRSWITIVRDPMLFSLQLVLHILVPLMISYSFMNQKADDACPRVGPLDVIDEAYRPGDMLHELTQEVRGAFENLGYVFFQIYVIIFAAVCVTSLTYPLVMHVLLKEYRNGWYSMSSYFLGRTLADLPVPTANVLLATAISYHLTGQPLSPYNWRFLSVFSLTCLATLVAQTQGLMFGALLMNLPQSAVFVAPASTAPLVVVSGFLLRIKQLPLPLQVLSKLSYFTHVLNGFVISRYGFNRCPCSEDLFATDVSHQIPAQTRGIMDIWVESFGPEYLPTMDANSNATGQTQQVDLIGKLIDTVTRAKTFGFEINDCSEMKPFAMLDYDLNDADLYICFAALVAMLFGFRWLTYVVLQWKINSCI